MTKVTVNLDNTNNATQAADQDRLIDIFMDLINTLEAKMSKADGGNWDRSWTLSISGMRYGSPVVHVRSDDPITPGRSGLELVRKFNIHEGHMVNDYFTMGQQFQKLGIANDVATSSLAAADRLNIRTAYVNANITVGAYAWLRKGAWPNRGSEVLNQIVKGAMYGRYIDAWQKDTKGFRSEQDYRTFVLSDRFRYYKNAFLGEQWGGTFDLTDPRVRSAMVGEYRPNKSMSKPIRKVTGELTANEKILNAYVRQQTYLLRYAQSTTEELLPKLAATETDLYKELLAYADRGAAVTLTGAARELWEAELEGTLRRLRGPAWDELSQTLTSEMLELATSEPGATATTIQTQLPVVIGLALPPLEKLQAIVSSQPFEGRTLKQWLERAKDADIDRMMVATKMGIIQGSTPNQVARAIVGTRGNRYKDAIARKAFRDVESIVLTVSSGIQNEARQKLYEANTDIIQEELFAATLDSRTTIICASNDGKRYKRGEGPMPPLHFRCRSLRVPYFNPDLMATRPFNPTTESMLLRAYSKGANIPNAQSRSDLPYGHKTKFDNYARAQKRQMIGSVPALTSYNEWLKHQPSQFQDEVLGVTRATLFRNEDITLDKFVTPTGELFTLEDLRNKGLNI